MLSFRNVLGHIQKMHEAHRPQDDHTVSIDCYKRFKLLQKKTLKGVESHTPAELPCPMQMWRLSDREGKGAVEKHKPQLQEDPSYRQPENLGKKHMEA